MKKLYTLIMIFFLSFIFSVDVKAESVDFVCKYKNEEDIIVINMRGERATKPSFGVTSQILNNKSEYTFYPGNYIEKVGNQYQTGEYYGFEESGNSNAVYGCPNNIYVAFDENGVIYLDVVDTVNAFGSSQLVNGQGSFKIPLIFFSNNALKIENNKLTEKSVIFEKSLDNTLKQSSYKTTLFALQKEGSGNVSTKKPQESNQKTQFCYYENSCGKGIQLKFTKGNINSALFNNGRGLNDWYDVNTCPTSIVDSNNLFQGKSTSCGSGATNCYSFVKQLDTEDSSLIKEGNCSVQSYDTNNGGVILTKYVLYRNAKENTNVNIYNKNGNIEAMINSVTLTIENTNNYSSYFLNKEKMNYPKYLIKEKGSSTYKFVESKKDEEGKYIETDEIYINIESLGVKGTGLSKEEVYATCKDLFGDTILNYIRNDILPIIWIGVPILLILLTSFDFAKVVFVDDKEGIQHAFQRFIKRAIAALLIFLTPTILVILVDVIGAGDTVQSCIREMRKMGSTSWIKK